MPSKNTNSTLSFSNNQTPPFIIENRTYIVINIFKPKESIIRGWTMLKRGLNAKAAMGRKHGELIYKHKEEIPFEFQKNLLVFPDWRHINDVERIAYLKWDGGEWRQNWGRLGRNWYGSCRLLKCISK